tara:strand:- start:916 stop:1671 length:756 start_codon:yes stop_codon:yes gene_type:complete
MHLDVLTLNHFYYGTKLGELTQSRIQTCIQRLWGHSITGQLAGFGFPPPFLSPFKNKNTDIYCLMPGQQGVMKWPVERNRSVLVEETSWPIATASIDRLIVAHGFETCDKPKELLQEIWRVMSASARVIFVVPNRTGLWARSDSTPFGYGRPYSIGQLKDQLTSNRFQVENYLTALYAPPSEKLYWLKTNNFFEALGKTFDSRVAAGAIILEASKQIYATSRPKLKEVVSVPLEVFEELAKPKPASKARPI